MQTLHKKSFAFAYSYNNTLAYNSHNVQKNVYVFILMRRFPAQAQDMLDNCNY